jgi:hypothetical protein
MFENLFAGKEDKQRIKKRQINKKKKKKIMEYKKKYLDTKITIPTNALYHSHIIRQNLLLNIFFRKLFNNLDK